MNYYYKLGIFVLIAAYFAYYFLERFDYFTSVEELNV